MSDGALNLKVAGIYDENHCYVMDEEGVLRIFRSMVPNSHGSASRMQLKELRLYVRRIRYEEDCIMLGVDHGMFEDYRNLESVVLSESITRIGAGSFKGCINLREINTGKVAVFGEAAFKGCNNIADIDLGSAGEIRASCFEYCCTLTDLVIPEQVHSIGEYAFKDCSNLKSVKAEGVLRFGSGCFQHDYLLCDFVFPRQSIRIGAHAFERTALKEVVIEHAKRIGAHAFGECSYLKEVRFTGETLPSCAFTAFHGTSAYGICKEETYQAAKMWSLRPAAGLRMRFSDFPENQEERSEA